MKGIFFIPLFFTSTLCSYLTGLNRTFDEVELKIVDFYVTMPSSEVNKLINMAQISVEQVQSGYGKNPDFKYEDAKIVAKWNGNEKTYEKVSFKTGGMYARSNDKVGFNVKLDKKFLGRKNIRLRPDANDKSHLRSKICSDIANRLGLPSIQATYARVYMNNEYWGLYVLMDAIKPSWVKQTFEPSEKEITTLYQCKAGGFNFRPSSAYQCVNANDDYQHMSVFKKFVDDVSACKTVQQVEKILDVDVFLKYLAMEWLIGSFDHLLINGHNINFYKRESDGKWIIIYYDYDNTFGNGLSTNPWNNKGANQDGSGGVNQWGQNTRGNDPVKYSFADWEMNLPIVKVLVHNNKSKFKSIVRNVLVSAFNPDLLNPHIHELKHFLKPYVQEDSTPGKNGKLPGRINKKGKARNYTVKDFENNVESSLKTWISTKFDVACKNYGFNKQEILNESAKYVPKGYDYPANHKKPKQETTTTTTTTTTVKKTTTTTTTTTTTVKPKTTTTTTTTTTVKPKTTTTTTTTTSVKPKTTTTTTTTTTVKPKTTTTVKQKTNTTKTTTTTVKPKTSKTKKTTTTTSVKPKTTTTVKQKTNTTKTTTTMVKPKTSTTKKTTTTTTTTSEILPTPDQCTSITKGYYPCGGLNYPDASPCCEEGFRCEYQNDFYYMCTPYDTNNETVIIKTKTVTVTKKSKTTTTKPKTTKANTTKTKTTTTIPKPKTTKTTASKTTSIIIPTPKICTSYTDGYYPCGGLNYPDASPCCEEGFQCEYVNEFYYRCALIIN
jgi:hypothetical protein